ncbi:SEC-C domain-containing protein [Mucilaginibacter sp.]|uniref:SEC-C domain-containing protein n=1 Tax=Mucilaginibacter sp. TaxID=1882438 RepID=UPI00261060D4|nr:SEC-C domain-containing protein [Mucilaginibacter sp.]
MTISDFNKKLQQLGSISVDLPFLEAEALLLKAQAVENNDEALAKQLWIAVQIIKTHRDFLEVFRLLRSKKYQDAWFLLERIDIEIIFLKRHFDLSSNAFKIKWISRTVTLLQALFPYRLFISTEMLTLQESCGICKQQVSIRKPCGHRIGEIYGGEMCTREITKMDFIGTVLVETPGNKYSVLFNESDDPKARDEQYATLVLLLSVIKNPYEHWGLRIEQRQIPHSHYPNLKADQLCPCGEGKSYKECCLMESGINYFHYEILLGDKQLKRYQKKSKRKK